MPVAKQKAAIANAAMKPAETNDSLDTSVRQAIGKEPSLTFSKMGDSPIQWIQLLHALDQQGTNLPGWPLLQPVKIQLQKCEKCSREFCSTINYRRHIRLHRRSLNPDKDSSINTREALATFWDKLSSEEAMEVVSFEDVTLEELAGSSIIKALASFIRKPGFSSLPPAYMRAGALLLDIVQARPSRFPMMARELFSLLDEASEKTFLCAGKAEGLQKYVFDGEAGKTGLEIRNLVASTSFLIEQKLVKAWVADKDAESLRLQKLLVEEEEAALKRQAQLLERKRLKKLRQKAKALPDEAVADSPDASDGGVLSPSASILLDPSSTPEIPNFMPESAQNLIGDDCETTEPLSGSDIGFSGSNAQVEHKTYRRNGPGNSRWHMQKLQRGSGGFHTKPGSMQKHTFYRDSRATSFNYVNKVWTPKPKSENDEESCENRSNTKEIIASAKSENDGESCENRSNTKETIASAKSENDEESCENRSNTKEIIASAKSENDEESCENRPNTKETIASAKSENDEESCENRSNTKETIASAKSENNEESCENRSNTKETIASVKSENDEESCENQSNTKETIASAKSENNEESCENRSNTKETIASAKSENNEVSCENRSNTKETIASAKFENDEESCENRSNTKETIASAKSENGEESCENRSNTKETIADPQKVLEVLIGSIPVAIGKCIKKSHEKHPGNLNADDAEPPVQKSSIQDKPSKADDRSVVKHWRPVSRVDSGGKGSDESLRACPDDHERESLNPIPAGKVVDRLAAMKFSSSAAEAFLGQRWKEAVAADHVEPQVVRGSKEAGDGGGLGCNGGGGGAAETKAKYKMQVQSGSKVKYIPKQRSG